MLEGKDLLPVRVQIQVGLLGAARLQNEIALKTSDLKAKNFVWKVPRNVSKSIAASSAVSYVLF